LSFNGSPDLPFDRSINAYRGCEHGCIYCYARPTHAYHDLSPGLDFETKLFAKPNAAELLRKTLAKPNYVPAPIAIGTNTDPYQPIEKRYQITRSILELMLETQHPIGITTKSNRIVDDVDLLETLAKKNLTAVAISITTLDGDLARILEPRAPSPANRLKAVDILSKRGIYVHVNIAPVIPAITDHEIESIVGEIAIHGAKSVSVTPLRLPHEVAPLFEQWLEAHFPDRKKKVMNLVASMRNGKRNDPRFHKRMKGTGPWADLLHNRLAISARKRGLGKAPVKLRIDLFKRPLVKGSQIELWD
jgi:DNA repair photolyase